MDNVKKKENAFHLHEGKEITDLKSLAKELRSMPQHVYEHHVNFNKNDFANWVKHSLSEHTLAERINGHISRIELELQVLRHLIDSKDNLVKKLQEGKKAKKMGDSRHESGDKKVHVKKENSKKVTIKKN